MGLRSMFTVLRLPNGHGWWVPRCLEGRLCSGKYLENLDEICTKSVRIAHHRPRFEPESDETQVGNNIFLAKVYKYHIAFCL